MRATVVWRGTSLFLLSVDDILLRNRAYSNMLWDGMFGEGGLVKFDRVVGIAFGECMAFHVGNKLLGIHFAILGNVSDLKASSSEVMAWRLS